MLPGCESSFDPIGRVSEIFREFGAHGNFKLVIKAQLTSKRFFVLRKGELVIFFARIMGGITQ